MPNVSFLKRIAVFFIFLITIISCKKNEFIEPEEVSLEITVPEIVDWQKDFVKKHPEFDNKIDLLHSQKTFFKNKHAVRVPFGSNGNCFYFYKTAEKGLQSFIARPDYEVINASQQVTGLNILNLDKRAMFKIVYSNEKINNIITYSRKEANNNLNNNIAIQETWFQAFLGCIAQYVFAIPIKIGPGEYDCLVAGWVARSLNPGDGNSGGNNTFNPYDQINPIFFLFPPTGFIMPPNNGDHTPPPSGGGGIGNSWGPHNPYPGPQNIVHWQPFLSQNSGLPDNLQRANLLVILLGFQGNTYMVNHLAGNEQLMLIIEDCLGEGLYTERAINAAKILAITSAANKLNGPYDIDYYNLIKDYIPKDEVTGDPITMTLYFMYLKFKKLTLFANNPTKYTDANGTITWWGDIILTKDAMLEEVQLAIDIVGIVVPAVGDVCDLGNGVIYLIHEDPTNAKISFAGAVPLVGAIPVTARVVKYFKKILFAKVDNVWHLAKNTDILKYMADHALKYKDLCYKLGHGLKAYVETIGGVTSVRKMEGWAKDKVCIIGRNMADRVKPFANGKSGAVFFDETCPAAKKYFTPEAKQEWNQLLIDYPNGIPYNIVVNSKYYAANKQFIKDLQAQGYTFIDLGHAGNPTGTSAFYDMELGELF